MIIIFSCASSKILSLLRYNIYLHLLSIILPGARPCRVGAGRGACECRGRGSWGRAAATGSAASVGHPAQSLLSAHGNGGNRALLGVAVPPARHSFSKVHYRVNFCSSDPDLCSSNRASYVAATESIKHYYLFIYVAATEHQALLGVPMPPARHPFSKVIMHTLKGTFIQ